MKTLNELNKHYANLLGLLPPWIVVNVNLDVSKKRVEIKIEWPNEYLVSCPICKKDCYIKDHREERRWRHLDTMQFETIIISRIPRSNCPEHGAKTINIPWATKGSRFTMLFERFAIDIINASKSLKEAGKVLSLSWDQIYLIKSKAVERGLSRRKLHRMKNIGIDEKSFLKGHKYASIMVDIDNKRVIDVVQDRTIDSTNELWNKLPCKIKNNVEAVAVDMWEPFITSSKNNAPNAKIVHDKFHISKYLNEAVDKIRREEHKDLIQKGNTALKGKRYTFLKDKKNMSSKEWQDFKAVRKEVIKTSKAWALKETFSTFWEYSYQSSARKFFNRWYWWATHSRLKPMIKVAKMIKRHFENIISYLKHRITNALIEGFNSKIQSIKANARGYRSFRNYRIAILFYCSKLDLYP